MRKLLAYGLLWSLAFLLNAQIVSLNPNDAGPEDAASITFDASEGGAELAGASKVYMHHSVVVASPTSEDWGDYVIGNWGADDGVGEMTKVDGETDKWEIVMSPSVREYFDVPETQSVYRISAVFRSADGGTKATLASGSYDWGTVAANGDFYIDLNVDNYLLLDSPDPEFPYVFLQEGESTNISATASSNVSTMKVWIDEGAGFVEKASVSSGTSISYDYRPPTNVIVDIKVTATVNGEALEYLLEDMAVYLVNETVVQALPTGLKKGINYDVLDDTKVTLVLEAPGKEFVFVTGDFNEWDLGNSQYQMKNTPDGELFWYELTGLTPGNQHLFQYQVNGEITVADPYSDQIADPWNDRWILEETYPNLPEYTREDFGPASVIRTAGTPYEWAASEDTYQKPDLDNLVIYELLVRDFIGTHSYKELADTLQYLKNLGIQAIELMPINEFGGNESWGYDPSFYFAPDKYYGTKNELKNFIEKAHEEGLAVIIDMVLNHANTLNPMAAMYYDFDANRPAADNPWFNAEYATSVDDWKWGNDFNHESEYTKAFVDSVNSYWIEEYHVDGFRFDFTKGMTQDGSKVNFAGTFDQSRIDILKRMADNIWEADPETYVILEHFCDFFEETELSNYGMKLWRNKVGDFHEVVSGRDLGRSFEGSDPSSHVVFMGSHDEQRIAYYPAVDGVANADGSYDIKLELIAFERLKQVAAFALLNPGPKMIWQFDELGYDIDINFNGRVGNKPLPWGDGGLGYYENELRRNIYRAYQGILDVRSQIGPDKMQSAGKNHIHSGAVRRLVYDTDANDLVVIGNFGVDESSISPAFTETGSWFNYFSGEEIQITDVNESITLAAGEWHIYTSERISDGLPGVVEIYQNPVSVSMFPFTQEDEITIRFDATKASANGTAGLVGKDKVYMHSGVVLLNASDDSWTNIVGTLSDDEVGLMTEVELDIWEITLTPEDYYSIGSDDDIVQLNMYFRDAANIDVGKGFRDEDITLQVELSGPYVTVNPPGFQAIDEVTITFNTAKGNRALINANKVYMHSSVDLVESETPWVTAWNNVIGNWGQDDGIGEMTQSTEDPTKWSITLTPMDYYGIQPGDRIRWLAAVFRSADGNLKGTGPLGEIENGIIAGENNDFFIRNLFIYPLSSTVMETKSVLVYPNPSDGTLFVETHQGAYRYSVIDLTGKVLIQGDDLDGQIELDISELTDGVYFLKIDGSEKDVIRFMKK